jgi:hypothetical protein
LNSSENTSNDETETESSETTTSFGMGHASYDDDEDNDLISVPTHYSQEEQELSCLLSDEKESELLIDDITLNDEALVYGEAHLLGVHRDSNGDWVFPKNNDLLRDIAIF